MALRANRPDRSSGNGPYLAIVIPDVTPDEGPFIPKHVGHALVRIGGGVTPWPILLQLIDLAESGDIVETDQAHATADDEILSNNVWLYDGKRFEVNSFYYSDSDAWCYELYEVTPDTSRNDDAEVQIPDANPNGLPFIPVPADVVTFTVHGEWNIPWLVFWRFIEVIEQRVLLPVPGEPIQHPGPPTGGVAKAVRAVLMRGAPRQRGSRRAA